VGVHAVPYEGMDFFETHNAVAELHCSEKMYADFCFGLLNELFVNDVKRNDITSEVLIPNNLQGKGVIVAHEDGVVAGLEEIHFFLENERSLKNVRSLFLLKDGVRVKKGEGIAVLEGPVLDLLKAERIVLNVIQRMSGIATFASEFVEKVPKMVLVTPTRKTLWGLLDKKACAMGGAGTHRLDLEDAVLVKDNHLAVLGKNFGLLFQQLEEGWSKIKHARFIEVEVTSLEDFQTLLKEFQNSEFYKKMRSQRLFVMLDNFKVADVWEACRLFERQQISDSVYLEASGGINLKNVSEYGKTGVHIISSGALTHSAPAFDCSFELSF